MGIACSPLNTSTAKSLYSFPRGKRFSAKVKKNTNLNAFYETPCVKSKRSTSFGYGTKFDFTEKLDKVPGPSHYENVDKIHKYGNRGISFGNGRDKVTFQGFTVKTTNVPGPGAYDLIDSEKRHIKGFCIKLKSTS